MLRSVDLKLSAPAGLAVSSAWGSKYGSESIDQDTREDFQGGQCVMVKRRLWPLKPNRPELVTWVPPLLAVWLLRIVATSLLQWVTDTKDC